MVRSVCSRRPRSCGQQRRGRAATVPLVDDGERTSFRCATSPPSVLCRLPAPETSRLAELNEASAPVQVSLQHDGAAQPMRVGSAILVGSLVEELESFFSNYGGVVTKSDDCVLSNARLVQEFAKLPGARPAAFERLLKAARAAEAKGGALDGD